MSRTRHRFGLPGLAGVLLAALATSILCWTPLAAQPAATGAAPPPSDLRPLPDPPLEGMNKPVREQLSNLRELVANRLAHPEAPGPPLFAGFARLGQLYLVYGLNADAEACFENARRLAPDDARWSYYLGVSLERQGRLEEAAKAYEPVLAVRPNDPATLIRRGWIELQSGHPDQATPWFERLLDVQPDSPAALFGLGQVASAHQEWDEAVRLYRKALEIQPDASAIEYPLALALRQTGDLEGAKQHLKRRGGRAPAFADPLVSDLDTLTVGPWNHLNRGWALLAQGDMEGALTAFRAAVQAAPESQHTRKTLARNLVRAGELAEAEQIYRGSLELDPDDPQLHHELGRVLAATGRLDEGIRHLRKAIELTPDFDDAYASLAVALERAGRLDEAADAAAQLVRLHPEDSAAYLEAGRLRLLARIDPNRDPVPQLRSLLDEDPDDGMARLTLGSLLVSRGDLDAGLEAFRAILDLEGEGPLKARAHLLLAQHADSPDAALEHLRAATRAASDLVATHLALAKALVARGDLDEAADAYRRAVSLEPSNPDAHLGRVRTLLAAGRCELARESFDTGLAATPQDLRWQELRKQLDSTCGSPAGRSAPPA